jgi:hypothetical protein
LGDELDVAWLRKHRLHPGAQSIALLSIAFTLVFRLSPREETGNDFEHWSLRTASVMNDDDEQAGCARICATDARECARVCALRTVGIGISP